MMKKLVHIIFLGLLCNSAANFAGSGQLFNVTSSNDELNIRTVVKNHTYPAAGIRLKSSGYAITSGCTVQKNGYCTFSVSDQTPATIVVSGPAGTLKAILCLDGLGGLSCQNYDDISFQPALNAKTAYIANNGGAGGSGDPTISLCQIDQTTQQLTTCQDAGGGVILNGIQPVSIVLNSANTQAFINSSDFLNSNIYQCAIDINTGLFSSCTAVSITNPVNYSAGFGFMALNPDNTLLYAVDVNNGEVLACPIVAGVLQDACTNTGATGIDSGSTGIAINQAGTTAYIGNFSSGLITTCTVSAQFFSNCVQHAGGGSVTFSRITGVALNQAETLLYVADGIGNKVYACTPSFSDCFVATSISDSFGIALNQANTEAYVTNASVSAYSCPILMDGTFDTCVSHSGFNSSFGVALGY